MVRFRNFLGTSSFSCKMHEENAPAAGGAPEAPSDPASSAPTKTNKDHFNAMKHQLGIGDSEMDAAMQAGPMKIFRIPDYSRQWGYWVIPPVTAKIEKLESGNFNVTFQLQQKQLMNPKSFIYPYKQGETPRYYDGPIQDQTVQMSEEELADAVSPLYGSGGQQGMMSPPPGGMGGGM